MDRREFFKGALAGALGGFVSVAFGGNDRKQDNAASDREPVEVDQTRVGDAASDREPVEVDQTRVGDGFWIERDFSGTNANMLRSVERAARGAAMQLSVHCTNIGVVPTLIAGDHHRGDAVTWDVGRRRGKTPERHVFNRLYYVSYYVDDRWIEHLCQDDGGELILPLANDVAADFAGNSYVLVARSPSISVDFGVLYLYSGYENQIAIRTNWWYSCACKAVVLSFDLLTSVKNCEGQRPTLYGDWDKVGSVRSLPEKVKRRLELAYASARTR